MRIVTANKYYYVDGGPEKYLFMLSEYLEQQGHDIIPFSVAYPRNEPSKYSNYFVPPAGGGEETKLDKLKGGLATKFRIAGRSVYSIEAKRALEHLLIDTSPDLLYCLNIVNHMSPSVIDAAAEHGVPVVLRLSDYYLICASYLFMRDGHVCMDCEKGFHHALMHNCVHGSPASTLVRVAGMYAHKFWGVYDKASAIVTTTQFMRDTLIRCGYPAKKLHFIPTFVNCAKWTPTFDNDGCIIYFGRLSPEKGIEFLLDAYNILGDDADPLVILGEGTPEYTEHLKSKISPEKASKVTFMGKRIWEELRRVVVRAKYAVVPSLWYDNAPNVVYESFAAGKPVIATAMGGLCEQVTEEVGVLVPPGDAQALAAAMERLSGDAALVETMGRRARARAEEEFSIALHTERLLKVFEDATSSRRGKQRGKSERGK